MGSASQRARLRAENQGFGYVQGMETGRVKTQNKPRTSHAFLSSSTRLHCSVFHPSIDVLIFLSSLITDMVAVAWQGQPKNILVGTPELCPAPAV